MYSTILLAILIIIIGFDILFKYYEKLQSSQIEGYASNHLGNVINIVDPVRHARLNEYGGVVYVDKRPPSARGEYSCYPQTCPSVFQKDIVCWKCSDIAYYPQVTPHR